MSKYLSLKRRMIFITIASFFSQEIRGLWQKASYQIMGVMIDRITLADQSEGEELLDCDESPSSLERYKPMYKGDSPRSVPDLVVAKTIRTLRVGSSFCLRLAVNARVCKMPAKSLPPHNRISGYYRKAGRSIPVG